MLTHSYYGTAPYQYAIHNFLGTTPNYAFGIPLNHLTTALIERDYKQIQQVILSPSRAYVIRSLAHSLAIPKSSYLRRSSE